MTAKEYLRQAFLFNENIKSKMTELESYRELSFSISGSNLNERVNLSRQTSALYEKYLVKIIDLEKQIEKDNLILSDIRLAIDKEIDKLDDINERLVLRYRYLMFDSWDEVAKKLNYSKRWTLRIHDIAILDFETMVKEKNIELIDFKNIF
ncbi:MAG: flagellar biosynthesis protein FliA [Clostridiales bacterium]|nr:flagellar biosynthesis protein FliA [Clostridiales bacterium]